MPHFKETNGRRTSGDTKHGMNDDPTKPQIKSTMSKRDLEIWLGYN